MAFSRERDRRPRPADRGGDLGDRPLGGPELPHLSRTVADLRGPFGPGLEDAEELTPPPRSSEASRWIVALEEPKRSPTISAEVSSTKQDRAVS
ncbi:MAG: hypothetical protein M0T79_15500 [Actinomycetota bacterium]|nr:hypothetical protein [Actinomycetota bacterium]